MYKDLVHATFDARIDHIADVHDGDTINHVYFRLPINVLPNEANYGYGEIYPEIYLQRDGVWVHVNVRVAGIDTPELHPRHHYPDGTPRPKGDIDKEHELALQAQEIVAKLLKSNDLEFEIRNPQEGKYAGRVVAEVWVKDPESQQMINIAERLIAKNLAYPYEGGTKRVWGLNNSA